MDINILKGSWIENMSWARTLNEMYGAQHPKAIAQWLVCNEIAKQIQELKPKTSDFD